MANNLCLRHMVNRYILIVCVQLFKYTIILFYINIVLPYHSLFISAFFLVNSTKPSLSLETRSIVKFISFNFRLSAVIDFNREFGNAKPFQKPKFKQTSFSFNKETR